MDHVNKNWRALFATNFLGIFNDNFLKHCIVFIAVTWNLPHWLTQAQLISIVSAALVVPYLILSPLAGRWSVIYSKQKVLRTFKLLELAIMMMASVAFYFEWVWLSVSAVFIMGMQSCMYSPAKYGLIRDVGGAEGVSFGSGIFETMAFLGILLGTVAASYLSDHYTKWVVFALFIGVAIAGYLTSRQLNVTELPEEKENLGKANPVRFMLDSYRFAARHKYINCGVLGASVFWLIGGMLQMNMVIHCVKTLGTSNTTAGIVLACAAVGIALGCTLAGLAAGRRVRPEMIPVGLTGMIVCLALLILFNPPVIVCAILIFCLAFMGGVFEVPCLALVQRADIGRELGNMVAYLNFTTFLFVLFGTVLFSVTTLLTHDNSLAVFGVIMAVCILMLLFYAVRYPEFFNIRKKD
ncbi:MAG: MFS transporter [Bacteroidota bacterium]|nr:MFS transporter [Bacteroidota bacterium]